MVKLFVWNMVLLFALLGLSHAYAQRYDGKQLVYAICNESRISSTIDERGCADLQDQLNMEFLCMDNNTSPSNYCWVEAK